MKNIARSLSFFVALFILVVPAGLPAVTFVSEVATDEPYCEEDMSSEEMESYEFAAAADPNIDCDNWRIKQGSSCSSVGFVCMKDWRIKRGCLFSYDYYYCSCTKRKNGSLAFECGWEPSKRIPTR